MAKAQRRPFQMVLTSGVAGICQRYGVGAGVGRDHAAQLKHGQRRLAKGLAAGLFQISGLRDVGVADHILKILHIPGALLAHP